MSDAIDQLCEVAITLSEDYPSSSELCVRVAEYTEKLERRVQELEAEVKELSLPIAETCCTCGKVIRNHQECREAAIPDFDDEPPKERYTRFDYAADLAMHWPYGE